MINTNSLLVEPLKRIANRPIYSISISGTFGVAMAALLIVFSLLYVALLKPLPYSDADLIYSIGQERYNEHGELLEKAFAYPNLINLYKNGVGTENFAISYFGEVNLSSTKYQSVVPVRYVTPEWFSIFDVNLHMGVGFSESESLNTFNPVAVISYETWQNEFSSNSDILEESVTINGVTYSIIGVTAKDYVDPQTRYVGAPAQVLLPWDYNKVKSLENNAQVFDSDFEYFLKVAKNTNLEQLLASNDNLVSNKWNQDVSGTQFSQHNITLNITRLSDIIIGNSTSLLWTLFATVTGLVIIAIINIINMFIARMAESQQQLAIRVVLGAKKKHILFELFQEAMLLMMLAFGISLLLSYFGIVVIKEQFAYYLPRLSELELDGFIVLVGALFALFIALLFSSITAQLIKYNQLRTMLSSSGKGNSIQIPSKVGNGLIGFQASFAFCVLLLTFNLTYKAIETINTPLGMTFENLATLQLRSQTGNSIASENAAVVINEIKNKLRAIPEVQEVSQSFSILSKTYGFSVLPMNSETNISAEGAIIDHLYFPFINQELLSGRNFDENDVMSQSLVAIVNQQLAETLGDQVLGSRISLGGPEAFTIIGVVNGVKTPTQKDVPRRIYLPSLPNNSEFIISLKPGTTLNKEDVVAAIKQVNGDYVIWGFEEKLQNIANIYLFNQNAIAITASIIALLTLMLSATGILGTVKYCIAMRENEIGIRMAVGARDIEIKRMFMINALKPTLFGILLVGILFLVGVKQLPVEFLDIVSQDLSPLILLYSASLVLVGLMLSTSTLSTLKHYIQRPVVGNIRSLD
ncbi:ABC transporter permease [Pseudoalteromonas luteoviolacea]|uniref:ABC transporter permease n=1 Tax=Pseudoalteromonas luteoviolacea TaxID=43657 RepID=UPI001F1EBE2A|nr:ABC transporter permease [Pseudoalteromonas luteoviolacea]MCF6442848.1 ABC transporter permease [Pseudoalteromonas luteoviolacea]